MENIIEGFPNYKITSEGIVYSRFKGRGSYVEITDEWKPLKNVLDKGVGYFLVTLVDSNGKHKNRFIHRLLAKAFIPNPLNKAHVNHIDGNKQNNSICNLEWCTPKENAVHAMKIGLCDERTKKQNVAILQYSADTLTYIQEHVSLHEAGRTTGIAWQNISKVARGIRHTAGGFHWKYK